MSVLVHVFCVVTLGSIGESLFPIPFGGLVYLELLVAVALVALGVTLAALRVGDGLVVWVVGAPPALVGLGLALTVFKLLPDGAWRTPFGLPGWCLYALVDSLAVAAGFTLAALLTDARLRGRFRFGVPAAVVTLTIAIWVSVYQVRYG
jgi:hypothetical protein